MTSRTVITISQREFLVRKFEEGMHSCGQNTLNARQAAATATGLTLNTINYWINKKRHTSSHCDTVPRARTKKLSTRRKLRQASGFNVFSKEFHKQQDLKGKTLSNKSKLMAQAWRKISTADKEKYNAVANDIEGSNEEEDEEELTPEKKRQLIVRVAKRHQGDANLLQSLGCEMATMMFVDKKVLSVGTTDGKKFLQSHPAILSSFSSYFLYDDLSKKQFATPATAASSSTTSLNINSSSFNVTSTNANPINTTSSTTSKAVISTVKKSTTKTTTKAAPSGILSNQAISNTDTVSTIFMKGRDGSIVATGTVLPGVHKTIHGCPCQKDCEPLSVVDVVQVGAEAWFEDAFGENKLSTGIIVEWPSSMISNVADVSPLHTRTNRKRK
ncbi:uncharacterized protein LOC135339719 isoform X2 [Halichondria panicea]|uniref:uncharacterized protein LOC135339719 isoform X2 n=1 Tax=Halichondria panicea TaxID=6063 RepID=UPI00312BA13D